VKNAWLTGLAPRGERAVVVSAFAIWFSTPMPDQC
jgi:hypothetical protein